MSREFVIPETLLEFEVPLELRTSLNSRMHPLARADRVKKERGDTGLLFKAALLKKPLRPLLLVRLIRWGPKVVDDDQLPGLFKSVRDEIARVLRIDDGSPLVVWKYSQRKGPYGAQVVLEEAPFDSEPVPLDFAPPTTRAVAATPLLKRAMKQAGFKVRPAVIRYDKGQTE